MHEDTFYCLGKIVYKLRWLIILFWLVLFLAFIPFLPKLMKPFTTTGFVDIHSQSAKADDYLNEKLGYSYNRFIIMYQSKKLLANSSEFNDEVKKSLSKLENFPIKHQIIYPEDNKKQISKDKHSAYAVVLFKDNKKDDNGLLKEFTSYLKKTPKELTMRIGGEPVFLEDTKTQTQEDLYKSEYIATPVAIITMLLVFGSVVAAILPILLGAVCALIILGTLFTLGHAISLSVFTINIALLLGLCLSLDYALFIVSRFRHEIKENPSVIDAIAVTQATAGKAVFFSALAVFVSLSALLLFPINILFSVGIGGLTAVSVAVAIAIFLLPAVLAVLNSKINLFPVAFWKNRLPDFHYWRWLVHKVVRHRYVFFLTSLIILFLMAYPFLHIKFGISDFRILPPTKESRQVFDIFKSEFGENKLSPIFVIVNTPHKKNILSDKYIDDLFDFSKNIKKDSRVDSISSIVNTDPVLTKDEYQKLYTGPKEYLTSPVKKLLQITTKDGMSVITVISKFPSNSKETRALIEKLRDSHLENKMTVALTGDPVNTIDVLHSIGKIFPYAMLWIMVVTYFILLILLRSIFLPVKAIITTLLSLCASYGALVFVFQEGHFHRLLHFAPQGILDISLLIIIFCALFGFSMDYEVFLLSRIKEYYEQTGNNVKSIVFGIVQSSRIISSAAIIVILICFSFMSADILMVKAFGLGIAIAIFVDAFLIRTILVPAVMAIMGKWSWYLPKWLDYILPKLSFNPKKREFKDYRSETF